MICFSPSARRGEDGRDAERDQREIGRAADDGFGVVEPETQKRDEQPELQAAGRRGRSSGLRAAPASSWLPKERDTGASRVHRERGDEEDGVAGESEQRPFDLLAGVAGGVSRSRAKQGRDAQRS